MSSVRPEPLQEGRFQLLEVIGEGGMATVYRAFDQRLQRPRAIKVLSPALAMRPQLRRRFLAEAQTMATLEESRVVRVFDMGEDGDRVFIVMELVEGGSLLDRVKDHGALPPRMAVEVMAQLCDALQVAHDAGVIHRDIKPHNVLLTRGGQIRITDFGIAQVQHEGDPGMTKTGAVLGTWGFMAPEQKSNAKSVDARADIYSAGATLWSLLRNEVPPELFMSDSEPEMFADIPSPVADVIKRSTRYRREERYPNGRTMAEALRAIVPMLPEDPEVAPLVPVRSDDPSQVPADTYMQFQPTGNLEVAGLQVIPPPKTPIPSEGTMVPELGERAPVRHDATMSGGDELASDTGGDGFDPQPQRVVRPWMIAVPLLGALAGAVVMVSFWPEAEPAARGTLSTPPRPAGSTAATTGGKDVPPQAASGQAPGPAATAPAAGGETTGTAVTSPSASTSPGSPAPTPNTGGRKPTAARTPESTSGGTEPPSPAATVEPPPRPPPETAPAPPRSPGKTGKFEHSSPAATSVGGTTTFAARYGGTNTLRLYFRGAGTGPYSQKELRGTGGTVTATVRVDDTMAGGIEYYIAEVDGSAVAPRAGNGFKPLKVAISP
jgi:serine/threonine-protein kinase